MAKVLGFILVMNSLLCCGHAEDANLIIDPNWSTFHPGESVTFICDMSEGEETDWQYELRRNGVQVLQYNPHKSFTLQPIQIDQSGEYQCCGLRKSSDDKDCSDKVSLTVTAQPKAKLTAGPTTIPVGGSVTLSCSVEPSAGWKYRWLRRTQNTPEVELIDEENREIKVTQGGIYQCIGKRGNGDYQSVVSEEVSFNITFSNEVVVTRRPNQPQIFSGESINLTCEVQGGETTEWTYEWMRDGKPVKVGNNKDVTVSDESGSGDYMCRCRRRDDTYSVTKWSEKIPVSVSVSVSTPVHSSSVVPMIIGPVGGILLVLLLVLLWYYRRSNDFCCPGCGVNNGLNKKDTDESSSPLHGDDHVYESVNFSDSSGKVADKPGDATYSLIELKNFGEKSTPNKPVEGAVYYRLESEMKGRGRPGAKEEAVYSEIDSGPENNNTI